MEDDVLDHGVVADPLVVDLGVLGVAHDVVTEGKAGRVRAGWLAVMLLESVVGELEAFLGAIGPQVPVHAVVDSVAVLVDASSPVVVPETTDRVLSFEYNDLRTVLSLVFQILEGRHSCSAGWTSANDSDSHSKKKFGR